MKHRLLSSAPFALLLSAFAAAPLAHAEEVGSVNTHFRVTGSDRVVVEAYDDPVVNGVTCYVSRARTAFPFTRNTRSPASSSTQKSSPIVSSSARIR